LKAVILWNNGDAGFRDRKTLCIGGGIKPNPLTGWNQHIFIDDAAFQVYTGSNLHPVKQDRIFDYGIFIHLNLREQDRMPDRTAEDNRSAAEQRIDQLSFLSVKPAAMRAGGFCPW